MAVSYTHLDSTDGLQRGMKVYPTGGPITMPIGEQIKGRLMNVVGDSIDPIGVYTFSCNTRNSMDWISCGIVPISSRNSVPPLEYLLKHAK